MRRPRTGSETKQSRRICATWLELALEVRTRKKSIADRPRLTAGACSVDRRLDVTADSEEVTVRAVLANDHQTYGRTRRLYRHSNSTTVEETDDRRIAQQ